MPTQRPKNGKPIWFVRTINERFELAQFVKYDDGSGSIFTKDREVEWECCGPDMWRDYWAALHEDGYIELQDAKAAGVVAQDFLPPTSFGLQLIAGRLLPVVGSEKSTEDSTQPNTET